MVKVKLPSVSSVCLFITLFAVLLMVFCVAQLFRGVLPWHGIYLDAILVAAGSMALCVFCLMDSLDQVRFKTPIRLVLLVVAAGVLIQPCLMMFPGARGNQPIPYLAFSEHGRADLRAAADKGDAAAQFDLGLLYAGGYGGLERDPVIAARWFDRAALSVADMIEREGAEELFSGTRALAKKIGEAREYADSQMTPAQRDKADTASQTLCSEHYKKECVRRLPPFETP